MQNWCLSLEEKKKIHFGSTAQHKKKYTIHTSMMQMEQNTV